jgi:class 3 adenylate cyclase/tetratricopeptide (TPR) repeat protein
MNVAEWLRGLGLEQYVPAFRDNDIDGEVLLGLTADDLRELGVASIGHRRRLLDAIARLADRQPSAAASPATSAAAVSSEAERRQLTVMFCDLVGSTGLSARLDPEDLREVIAAYHRAVAEVVRGFDGFVAKYMGDGVLAYFGYPRAHEDDAERAIRAGLGVVDAVGRLDSKSVALQARIGIATGLVVVGDLIGEGSAQEQSVVGETPNLAARLQSLAEPNAVVIAASTRRLVGDLFEYRDLGSVEVKGIDIPVPAWHVLRPSIVESRFEALRGSALTPLVGRDEEIDLLLRRWARAKGGDGQVVLVSGEPGIGKSRITAALVERLQGESHIRLRYFCSPYRQDSALFPFIDQLGRAAEFAGDDTPPAKLKKLESLLARAAPPPEDVALLSDLLSLPGSERRPLPNLSPERKKQRTLEALIRQLEGLACQQQVVMVFEDAHWIDPTSRELLDLTIERLRTLPVLLLVTFRPDFQPPWAGLPQVTVLALNRLDRRDRTTLVAQISGGKALPDEVVDQIADRTDGVPLFVEELTKTVLESGLMRAEADRYVLDGTLPPLAIPTTLHDSLMARLDRLDSMKRVAQIGAAIGREFPYTLLRTVSGLYEDELQTALGRLVASELAFQRGTPPEAVYSFKHALVQDAAHGSLLRSARQQLHARIAEALETHSPETVDSQPEILAQHYAEARLVAKSIAYWEKAGRKSTARAAMPEAAAQFEEALRQLRLLSDTPERQRQEAELCSSLAAALYAAKGLAPPETGQAYARAHKLYKQLGSPSEILDVLRGRSLYHAYRGELDLALHLVEEILALSRQHNDTRRVISGLLLSGQHLMCFGKFASSRLHLEEALTLQEPVALYDLNFIGTSGIVGLQAYLGNVLFYLGYPDQARARSNAAIAEAGRLARPPTLATSLAVDTRLLSLVGDNAGLAERADQLVAVGAEQGFPHWRAQGMIYRGWAKLKSGDVTEGTALLRAGLAAYRSVGSELFVPHYLGLQAKACEIAGQIKEALSLLDDALQRVERTGERWLEAELNRHKGELLLRQGHTEAAEELYRKALGIAEEQEAKLWELRAAASLARLRRDQGRRAEAQDMLAPVYDWFTEGFDTPDLKDARALLDELA